MFGARASAEIIAPVRAIVGGQTPWVGFHSFGEIAPLGAQTRYHNYTVALCAVYDGVGSA